MSGEQDSKPRPYDLRWGSLKQTRETFGISPAALKAASARGWVRARQCSWNGDARRTRTLYCFEDVHNWIEGVAHAVSDTYAERWWTDTAVERMAEAMPQGPYARGAEAGAGKNSNMKRRAK